MLIFKVSITTMESLENVSLKVSKELNTLYEDTCLHNIYHSKSQMHFVQPGQKIILISNFEENEQQFYAFTYKSLSISMHVYKHSTVIACISCGIQNCSIKVIKYKKK
jgi:hypothetical protein